MTTNRADSDFQQLSALRGLDERQRRMLDLRAAHAGTRYSHVVVEGQQIPALPWDKDTTEQGTRIPASRRRPLVQLGVPGDIVDRIVDLAVGQGRFPAIEVEGDDAGRLREVALGDDDLELAYHAPDQLEDLTLVGSALLGFSRQEPEGGVVRWESVRIRTEWAEPVFVGGRYSDRARQLAAELAEVPGSGVVADPDDGLPVFALPVGARSDDVAFVCHQWPVAEEVAHETSAATRDRVTWYRRDYTSTAIIDYEPVSVHRSDQRAPVFVPRPVEPHNWGVVPLVWIKARGAAASETEGRSILTPPVLDLTAAADRSKSFETQASWTSGAPVLIERDVTDSERDALMLDPTAADDADVVVVGPKSVIRYNSVGDRDGEVFLLEPNAAGIEALRGNVETLVDHAYETGRVVRHDPEKLGGALSGLAVERLNEPSMAQAESYRAILGRAWRILLNKLAVAMDFEGEPGVDAEAFEITLRWPRIFRLTAQDITVWVTALSGGVAAGLLLRETAIKLLASILEVEDAEAEAEQLLIERGLAPFSGPRIEQPAEEE